MLENSLKGNMNTFANLVDEVRNLEYEELIELNEISKKRQIELEREELALDHKETMAQYRNDELFFTSDISILKNELSNL